MKKYLVGLILIVNIITAQGCATYTTPAAGVNISSLTDADIAELMRIQPESPFPARLAVARIQASGYYSRTTQSYGTGNYSIVTTRDIEEDIHFKILSDLPLVSDVAPLSRLLLSSNLETIKDIRIAAAKLKTDLLLIYSIDTSFHIEGTPLGPLSAITLGFLPNKKAFASSTTSGAIIDVRTGFVYGVAEANEKEDQRANIWNTRNAIDESRLRAEKSSFDSFLKEFEKLWRNTINQYAKTSK